MYSFHYGIGIDIFFPGYISYVGILPRHMRTGIMVVPSASTSEEVKLNVYSNIPPSFSVGNGCCVIVFTDDRGTQQEHKYVPCFCLGSLSVCRQFSLPPQQLRRTSSCITANPSGALAYHGGCQWSCYGVSTWQWW